MKKIAADDHDDAVVASFSLALTVCVPFVSWSGSFKLAFGIQINQSCWPGE
jgi:hypothetical protein